jgi:hypothetical protein
MKQNRPFLIVSVDVEEDNWGFHHNAFAAENVRRIPRLQRLLDRYRVKPTYLISYPVASCELAAGVLSEIQDQKKCEIGAHLHPWNTPPVTEDINERNSMLKNLPYDLQAAKLRALTDKIGAVFGRRPSSFRAGRWALGPDTVKALAACDYLADCSVTPTVSWVKYEGAEYLNAVTEPYWLSPDGASGQLPGSILEVPATIGFNRWPFEFYQNVELQLRRTWMRFFRPLGLMHHAGILRKIWLSPEISTTDDMILLSKIMINNGMTCLNMSFHSTTLLPGKSPFVKNERELERFYRKIELVLEYLTSITNVVPLTLSEVRARMPALSLSSN